MKEIKLTQGKTALVDDADFEEISKYKWCAHKERNTWYACRNRKKADGRRGIIKMHRQIFDPEDRQHIDHIDGDGLNNQRANLRACTNKENLMNQHPRVNCSSRFKGVNYHNQNKRWRATITDSGKQVSIGCFATEEEAAIAYNAKASELFGNFARLNAVTGAVARLSNEIAAPS